MTQKSVMVAFFLFILIQMVNNAPPIFSTPNTLRTGMVSIFGFQTNQTQTYTQSLVDPFGLAYDNGTGIATYVIYKGVGILGYDSIINTNFYIEVSAVAADTTQIHISAKSFFLNIIKAIHISYFVINNYQTPTVQISNYCLATDTNLSSNEEGIRFQVHSYDTTFTSRKLYVMSVLTRFKLSNLYGSIASLNIESSHIEGTKTIQTLIQTDGANKIQSVCFEVVVLCPLDWQEIKRVGTRSFSNLTTGQILNSTYEQKYLGMNRTFYGISGFKLNNFAQKKFLLNISDIDFTKNYTSNAGTFEVVVNFFMITVLTNSSCPTGQLYDQQNQNCITASACVLPYLAIGVFCKKCYYACLTCNTTLDQICLTCDSSKFRTLNNSSCPCNSGYVDNQQSLCTPCQSFIKGCLSCIKANYSVYCTNCGSLIPISNIYGVYQCGCNTTRGYFSNTQSLCINTTACIAYDSNLTTLIAVCTKCDTSIYFKSVPNPTNKFCQCMVGYSLNGTINTTSICLSVCGDGIKVTGEQCDNANTNNGDGCSSVCKVENLWTCVGSPSICSKKVLPKPYDLTILYVARITEFNKMRLALKIAPQNLPFTISQILTMITHNVPASSIQAEYLNGKLLLDFSYTETIEGKTYSLNFTANSSFPDIKSQITIQASGINAMLTYDVSLNQTTILSILVIVLDCIALFALIFSIFSQILIGIQMIQTIQSVFFLVAFMKSCPAPISALKYLRYSNGYNYLFSDQFQRTYLLNLNISFMGIEKQFLLNFNVMFGVLLICIVITQIIRLVIFFENRKKTQIESSKRFLKNDKKAKQQHKKLILKLNRIKLFFDFILRKILLLVLFVCMFMIIFCVIYQMKDIFGFNKLVFNSAANNLGSLICLAVITITILTVVTNYFIPNLQLLSFKNIKQIYPLFYVFYQTAFIILVSLANQISSAIFIILVLIIFNIALTIYLRPYPETKHNSSLIFHQIVILVALGLYAYFEFNKTKDNQKIEIIVSYFLLILLVLVVVINIGRMWVWRTTTMMEVQQKYQQQEYVQLVSAKLANKLNAQQLGDNLVSGQNNLKPQDFQWFYNSQLVGLQANKNKNQINDNKNQINDNKKELEEEIQEDEEKMLKKIKERLKKEYKRDNQRHISEKDQQISDQQK